MAKLIIAGKILDTETAQEEITKIGQDILDILYNGEIGFDSQMNGDTIKLIFIRDLRYDIEGGFLCDNDMEMISGLDISAFMPQPLGKPIIVPLMPYRKHFYCPDTEFIRLYRNLVKSLTGQKIKKMDIDADDCRVNVKIKF
ncbi:hypothetical protein NE636_07565 [Bacteroides thetaiotaomicron]|uniref:hypothetical protein n=1 Tax=Bacteroides thetaiotaomicron TaxID=818 RepID=UPI001C3805CC|nr:hypothetical protein [Bacteroides thetaiotaomicron]MBV4310194.1 hypothetical protein [Bacteroides thetaiotaomicron]MBV4329111.1 hypothetical protein [Bacteroides thetaiotaomicron]MCB7383845.1 hypothetical protein [Bacteroides thetaiotaomicron]MCG4883216.1 hypothetical protein [Bacteroides thetaiotaomicron]MCG4883285.1 hypothetical protein [Bacteroides thetaiotaomicron]